MSCYQSILRLSTHIYWIGTKITNKNHTTKSQILFLHNYRFREFIFKDTVDLSFTHNYMVNHPQRFDG